MSEYRMGCHYHLGFLKISGFLIETYSELLLKIKVGAQIYFIRDCCYRQRKHQPTKSKIKHFIIWGTIMPQFIFSILVLYPG
jgi:hypothetical protein